MFNKFEESIPERFSWEMMGGKCHAVWLSGKHANVGYRFELGYILHGDRPTSVFGTFEIIEAEAENLGSFIQNHWAEAGFASEDEAVSYYEMEFCHHEFFVTDGFTYKFRRVK